jgi:Putative type VII ESX secretion system translocon, EccE
MSSTRLTYRFGPLERRGLLGGIRLGQVGVLAAGAAVAIAIIDIAPDETGAFGATLVFAGTVALALVPVGRRTAEEWAPIVASFALCRLRRRLGFRSQAPTRGARVRTHAPQSRDLAPGAGDPPPPLADLQIIEAVDGEKAIGALAERRGRLLTAVLACRVVAFSLLDAEAQERRLARWGLVLSGAAGTAIRRLQWVERTAPAQGDELARWLHDERDPAVPLRGTPMIESYLELIGTSTRITQEHEILIAVQIDARRARASGARAASGALIEATDQVVKGLEAAEVGVLGALSAGQLAQALRTAFDPYARSELAALHAADPARDGLAQGSAWPLGARECWDHYRTDGAVHTTYWIGGWPRVEVPPTFLDTLLGRSGAVRTVAVTLEPIPADRSTREVEAAVTRDHADRELRRRFGQSETARQRQAEESTARREEELAAGHAEVRLTGFVTVSARDAEELRRSSAVVLEDAARARLELHRMYGQQADAFTFTLPLCRGLR